MKKICGLFIIFLLVILFGINIVNADMDAPQIQPFYVTVSNENGASFYESHYDETFYMEQVGTLEYGTKVRVSYSIDNENITYYYFESDEGSFYIKKNDVTVIEETNEDTIYDESTKEEYLVVTKNELMMYKGPGNNYAKLYNTIPYGTKIVGYRKGDMSLPWVYCTYNGISGWIYDYDGVLARKSEYINSIIMPQKTILYKNVELTEPLMTINANTIISNTDDEINVYDLDSWSQKLFVKYNGYSGFISYDSIGMNFDKDSDYTFDINYETKMYEKAFINSTFIQDIPSSLSFKPLYAYIGNSGDGWIYVEYNGKKGWIFYAEDITQYNLGNYEEIDDIIPENQSSVQNIIEENIIDENEIEENKLINNKLQNTLDTSDELSNYTTMNLCISIIIAALVTIIIALISKNNKLIKKYNEKK